MACWKITFSGLNYLDSQTPSFWFAERKINNTLMVVGDARDDLVIYNVHQVLEETLKEFIASWTSKTKDFVTYERIPPRECKH
jgi:hypothetical protein